MSSQEWTLERELCKIADCDDVSDALVVLGMLDSAAFPYRLSVEEDWHRGGAETFIFRFRVEQEGAGGQDYVIKACIAYAPADSLSDLVTKWVKWRNLLAMTGVRVPKLVYAGEGQIIEEYIPWPLRQCLTPENAAFSTMLLALTEYAGHLTRLQFSPVSAFVDLRSRGEDVVAIDFGSDLGPAGEAPGRNWRLFEEMLNTLRDWQVPIDMDTLVTMRERFGELIGRRYASL